MQRKCTYKNAFAQVPSNITTDPTQRFASAALNTLDLLPRHLPSRHLGPVKKLESSL